jgi:hypothetical protein
MTKAGLGDDEFGVVEAETKVGTLTNEGIGSGGV